MFPFLRARTDRMLTKDWNGNLLIRASRYHGNANIRYSSSEMKAVTADEVLWYRWLRGKESIIFISNGNLVLKDEVWQQKLPIISFTCNAMSCDVSLFTIPEMF